MKTIEDTDLYCPVHVLQRSVNNVLYKTQVLPPCGSTRTTSNYHISFKVFLKFFFFIKSSSG